MAVSTTQTWTLPMDEIIDAAYARVGGEQSTGWEAQSAMRNLNVLFQLFQSRRVNLWTIQQRNFVITDNTQTFILPEDVIDIVNAVTRINPELTTRTDIACARFSRDDWVNLPNKNSWGRPMNYWLDRQRAAPQVTLWPVNRNIYVEFVYWAVCRTYDNNRMRDNVDAPVRWIPAIIAGLAWLLGLERGSKSDANAEIVRTNLPRLKSDFDEAFGIAWEEDRDSALLSLDVDLSGYYNV